MTDEGVETFWGSLPPGERTALAEAGATRWHFRAGEALAVEGESVASVWIIVFGLVAITADTASGTTLLLSVKKAGDIVGAVGVLDGRPGTSSVIAKTDCDVISLGGDRFRNLVQSRPPFALALLHQTSRDLRASEMARMILSESSTRERVIKVLIQCVRSIRVAADSCGVELPLSQPELASMCGISTSSAARAIADLQRRGLVESRYRQLVIPSVADLERYGERSWAR